MSNIEQALRNAIKTIELLKQDINYGIAKQTINELLSALAEIGKCEPVNEVYEFEKWITGNTLIRTNLSINLDYADPLAEIAYRAWKARAKLYTSPQQREWIGLSFEDIAKIWNEVNPHTVSSEAFARAIEAKLKQLNTKG